MRFERVLAVLVPAALVLPACGGDAEGAWGAVTTTTTTTTTTPTTTTTKPKPKPESQASRLTGLTIKDKNVRNRPVVAIKIDNDPVKAVPQSGISQADVVYEIQVEGHITRLLALFHSTDAQNVGPVRSARASEIALLEELNQPLFTWHGANAVMGAQVRQSAIHPRSIDDISHLFYRDGSRPAPHNSFVHGTAQIRETAPAGAKGPTKSLFAFAKKGQKPSPHAKPATAVDINFTDGRRTSSVHYDWDGNRRKWMRSQAGRPHVDTANQHVGVDNVIVRFTPAVDEGRDSAGSAVPTAQFVGEGEVWVFTRGTVTVGKWVKPNNKTPTKYLDADGKQIRMTPGKTWVSVPYTKNGSGFS